MFSGNADTRRKWITWFFAILILTPSMLGFVAKFMEFVHTFQGDEAGVFAITPMVNYLLASAGFFCLLTWATFNGMFRDIEQPKHTMLDHDQMLDRAAGAVAAPFPRREPDRRP